MKQIFKEGARLFGRLIIVFFMSVFICVSISGICTAIFTEEIGYEVYGLRKNEEKPVLLYTHYSKDGEDAAMKEYEGQGYSLRKVEIRSDLGKTGKAVQMTLTQTLALLALIAAICSADGSRKGNIRTTKKTLGMPVENICCGNAARYFGVQK